MINFEKIIDESFKKSANDNKLGSDLVTGHRRAFYFEGAETACKEAVKQAIKATLKKAAEEGKVEKEYHDPFLDARFILDKDSIVKLQSQLEKDLC